MKTEDFSYDLPEEYIAQLPIEPRHAARLMVIDRKTKRFHHTTFWELGDFLTSGDLLVINQTKVIAARIFAHKTTGGKVEVLLLRPFQSLTKTETAEGGQPWEAMVGGKNVNQGTRLLFNHGIEAEVVLALEGSGRVLRFSAPVEQLIALEGKMPLPPYIHQPLRDPERYQTVYARDAGSAAAPTAGLHFTPQLIDRLMEKGVEFATVTLHVGLDTFAPVNEDDPTLHRIHREWCQVPAETVDRVRKSHANGKRIVAVGTTSARSLETAGQAAVGNNGILDPYSDWTELFILPGYQFRVVNSMITNFHLPRSTLLMMVSAFAGRDLILGAYQEAIAQGYRFYSFGDAMVIL